MIHHCAGAFCRIFSKLRLEDHLLEHPEGIGLSFTVGDAVKSNMHNDYLLYAVSYGFFGGVAYTFVVIRLLVFFFRNTKLVGDDRAASAVYLAGLGVSVAVAVNSMTDHMTGSRWYFIVIWSLMWYSYFCSRGERRRRAASQASSEVFRRKK